MIVDAHTHIFPESFIERRDGLLADEPAFAELYSSPRARMATAAEVIRAMDEAGVDRAVIAGFTWVDAGRCVEHNDALLETALASGGRLLPFCCVPLTGPIILEREMRRCVASGAAGFGEVRPESIGVCLDEGVVGQALGEAAAALGSVLLIHASEPVGHQYAGKTGSSIGAIWRFLTAHPTIVSILAHLGGGLPFYAHMPEVQDLFTRTYVDTAAVPWLYEPSAIRTAIDRIGAGRIMFGSDFPLRHPARDLEWMLEGVPLDEPEQQAILGSNALELLERHPAR
jgi:predicted TIM-barrel fold metal-dependent hydrolase